MDPQRTCPACGAANAASAGYCNVCAFDFNPPPSAQGEYAYSTPDAGLYGYPAAATPVASTPEDRQLSMVMWILSLFVPILGPLIFLLACQNRPLIYRNSLHAVGLHVWVVLAVLVLILGTVATCGIGSIVSVPLLVLIGFMQIVLPIVGAVQSLQGKVYEPLFSGSMSKKWIR